MQGGAEVGGSYEYMKEYILALLFNNYSIIFQRNHCVTAQGGCFGGWGGGMRRSNEPGNADCQQICKFQFIFLLINRPTNRKATPEIILK